MGNLGGHCVESLLEQFSAVTTDRPTVFIAYTVKGWGTPLAGHKDNHAGQMTGAQIETLRRSMNVREGHEWDPGEGLPFDARTVQDFLDSVPFNTRTSRRLTSPRIASIGPQFVGTGPTSTQTAFGKILDAIAKTDSPLAQRIVTTSPDVTVRPISAPGQSPPPVSPARRPPTSFRPSASPARRSGSSRPRGSTSSSALPK